MISDDLGNQAVRRFYDLTSQTFDARRVALNAFLAGNDLLYIGDFSSASDPDSYTGAIAPWTSLPRNTGRTQPLPASR